MDKMMDKICEMFHDVLHELAAEGAFKSANDVQTAKAAVSGILKIKTLEAMERFDESESYRGGKSYRRSMDDGHTMRDKLEHLMNEASGREREMIMEMISKM